MSPDRTRILQDLMEGRHLRADALHLEAADLRAAVLSHAHWTSCVLRDAILENADFSHAVLRLCDLDGARAANAVFTGASVENCTACGARFDGADFTGASLTDTDFSRASMRSANLEKVSATGAGFRGADLQKANLRHADLTDADLRGADLTGADLTGAELHGADLRGAVGYQAETPEPLAETIAPMVSDVLRTAGYGGAIDPGTAARVCSLIPDWSGILPRLLTALSQPADSDPPEEVKALIQRLAETLSLDQPASAEDVLARLTGELSRSPHVP